jgi:hypothetical protein
MGDTATSEAERARSKPNDASKPDETSAAIQRRLIGGTGSSLTRGSSVFTTGPRTVWRISSVFSG